MLYWLTNIGASAAQLYWEMKVLSLNASESCVPVAITVFPDEYYHAPRSWAEWAYPDLIYLNQVNRGGHFAAWEQPELFPEEVRAAFRSLRYLGSKGAGHGRPGLSSRTPPTPHATPSVSRQPGRTAPVNGVVDPTRKGALMSQATTNPAAPLTVVLVHGAYADASSWNGVITRLLAKGIRVMAPANPLRGIAADSAYTASVLQQIEGPVLAVGHSYGGAVITNAATAAKNVVGLVYVAAFAPEEGETLGAAEAGSKDSILNSVLVPRKYPTADGGSATEFYIDPARARDAFASDLSDQMAALIGATQRPVAELAFSEPSGAPAWKRLPSWAVVATGDKAAGTDVIRSMAQRARATITEVEGSHVIMISQPQVVTDVILSAVAAVGPEAGGSDR